MKKPIVPPKIEEPPVCAVKLTAGQIRTLAPWCASQPAGTRIFASPDPSATGSPVLHFRAMSSRRADMIQIIVGAPEFLIPLIGAKLPKP